VKVREVGESYYNEYIPGVVKHLEEIGLISVDGGAKLIWPPGTKHENPLIVVKSDGGYGYDSTDMAAIWYRLLERKADWVIYVTDAGQASHFELIFAAAIAAGWTSEGTRLDHVPFGMVCGDDGKKFKTRSGDTVRLVDLLDEAVTRMYNETTGRNTALAEAAAAAGAGGEEGTHRPTGGGGITDEEELKRAANILGYGACKYADLKSNRISNYIFSYEKMLSPNGNTAVYLLYAGARIAGILRKAYDKEGVRPQELLACGERPNLVHPTEIALGRAIYRFQEIIESAVTTLLPNVLCEYLYEMCNSFTKFYQACKVIGDPEMKSRLLLIYAVDKVLRKGYELLGIGYLERI